MNVMNQINKYCVMLMTRNKYRCIVCGRVFSEGQGIVIKYGNILLYFHSNRCVSKFFRKLLEITPYDELGKYIKEISEEFVEQLKKIEETKSKKI